MNIILKKIKEKISYYKRKKQLIREEKAIKILILTFLQDAEYLERIFDLVMKVYMHSKLNLHDSALTISKMILGHNYFDCISLNADVSIENSISINYEKIKRAIYSKYENKI